ncbi:MAG: flagellar hook capping FlgD N-terminal domain-containing protein [Pseudomonadota bacterium]
MEDIANPALLPKRTPSPGDTAAAVGPDGAPVVATTESSSAAASDFESFLTLLTAQLRNQDPMQPIDSTEFVAQLASFSTVEQLIGTNERLDALTSAQAAGDLAAIAGWIGQEAAATDGRFVADGGPVPFDVPIVEGASTVRAELLDAAGTVIRSLDVEAGDEAVWDGLTVSGASPVGETLRLRLVYLDGDEILSERAVPVFGRVVALSGGPDGATLEREDGLSIAPDEVATLRAPPVLDEG